MATLPKHTSRNANNSRLTELLKACKEIETIASGVGLRCTYFELLQRVREITRAAIAKATPPVVPPEPEPDFDPLAAALDACDGDIELTETKELRAPTTEDILVFCQALTVLQNAVFLRHDDTVNTAKFRSSKGGKVYTRIERVSFVGGKSCPGSSAHCFVKLDDGTLWKAASWKGPAKNFPRGSVFDKPATPYAGQ